GTGLPARSRRRPRQHTPVKVRQYVIVFLKVLGAAVSGLLVYTSHEPFGWWITGILGIGVLFLTLSPHRGRPVGLWFGALLGFIHGLVQYLLLLPWIGEFVGNLPYIALAVVCSVSAPPAPVVPRSPGGGTASS